MPRSSPITPSRGDLPAIPNAVTDLAPIAWLTDWDAALAVARATRKVVLIDVWKDP